MAEYTNKRATRELSIGTLTVEWCETHFYGSYWDPPETDVSDPEVKLDGKDFPEAKWPKGLAVLIEKMYCNEDDSAKTVTPPAPLCPDYD